MQKKLLVYKDRVKPNSCEGRFKKKTKQAGENDNQSIFKEEVWDTPPHPTPKHPGIALCVLKSPLDMFNSKFLIFSKRDITLCKNLREEGCK
jgi:hypothetical protein